MIIKIKYKIFVSLLRDWNIEYGLGLNQPLDRPVETSGPSENDRAQMWQAGNSLLLVMTEGPDQTGVFLRPPEDGSPADNIAIRAWDRLENLINEVNVLFEPVIVNCSVSELL